MFFLPSFADDDIMNILTMNRMMMTMVMMVLEVVIVVMVVMVVMMLEVAARPGGAKRLECTVETIFLHLSNW